MQEQQHGLGSWHPAMRPNADDLDWGNEESTAKVLSLSANKHDTASVNETSYRLPFRPNDAQQDQPLNSASSPEYSQSSQASPYVGGAIQSSVSGLQYDSRGSKAPHSERPINQDETEEPSPSSADIEPVKASSGNSPHVPDDTPNGVEQQLPNEELSEDHGLRSTSPLGIVGGALGDKAHMDRAWATEERESPTTSIVKISRTNSFPVVPPVRHTKQMPPHSLPHSQAEDIMEENESTAASTFEIASDRTSLIDTEMDARQTLFEPVADKREGVLFTDQGGHERAVTTMEVDEESRYEEGLPLMSTLQRETSDYAEAEGPGAVIGVADLNSQNPPEFPAEPPSFKPHPLDRKSTNQVLDSMHYAPHNATHDEPRSGEDDPPMTDTMGNGIPDSVHAAEERLSAEVEDPFDSQNKDEDLTELWKAALGDDDLLEELDDSVDPSAFFEDDGEGFLDGDQSPVKDVAPQSARLSDPKLARDSNGGAPAFGEHKSRQESPQNMYSPSTASYIGPSQQARHSTSLTNQSVSAQMGSAGVKGQPSYAPHALSRPQMPASTQSFADKSKGGYTSPYDLPMDVTRPKRRTAHQQINPNSDTQPSSNRPPPPRSSSMFTGAPPLTDAQPPVPRIPNAYSTTQLNSNVAMLKASPNVGSFFEELPSSKSRPQSSAGRSVQSTNQPMPDSALSSHTDPSRQFSLPQSAISDTTKNPQQYQLLPPERMSLYGNAVQTEHASHVAPTINPRYSHAPVHSSSVPPPPPNRYAASPSTGTRAPPPQAALYQPRTSSPLAPHHSLSQQGNQGPGVNSSLRPSQSSSRQGFNPQDTGPHSFPFPDHRGPQDTAQEVYSSDNDVGTKKIAHIGRSPPPRPTSQPAHLMNARSQSSIAVDTPEPDHLSSEGTSAYLQNKDVSTDVPEVLNRGPAQRSYTQSPATSRYAPEAVGTKLPYQRPASVNHQKSLLSTENVLSLGTQARTAGRAFSHNLNYITPTDGREQDNLDRWKGCPIFSFGFGGAVVTSFPKQIPRYAAGQAVPMIKCSPGEVKLQDGKILPFEEDNATFPGPLRSKGKKKDVIDWLQRRIAKLEDDIGTSENSTLPLDRSRCREEKILLWKVVRILVEYDGILDKSPLAEKAIRSLLSPGLSPGVTTSLSHQTSNASLLGITRQIPSRNLPEATNSEALEDLRKILLHGEREKAVWHAVDNRLWPHAMLLSSTLDKDIWKQVSQEFVRQEVKTYGENTEALAALYQVFAGNWDESADELVPPSARAGLQMMSKTTSTGPSKNALDGLDRWRETLTLILSNRSPDDGKALVALGRLLSVYGRTEAAHICYLFAKSPGLFSGPDDPQASIVLLGIDHIQHPFDYTRDLDSILLTEVYEFARSVLAPSSIATVSPHLQSFKLYHAMILAEYGYKTEAQQYCEVITSSLNSTTKRSPYYHPQLYETLNSLMERLRQAPRDSSGSWISKPSIDKVSGSIWAKFNQYVAGDESDAASVASGKGQDLAAGPFTGVAGGSPTISRTPSSNDLYNSYASSNGMSSSLPTSNQSNSRYAPAGLYTPRSSLEQQGRSVTDHQRLAQNDSLRSVFLQQQYQSRPSSSAGVYKESYKSTYPHLTPPTRTDSYLPTPPPQPQYMPAVSPDEYSSTSYRQVVEPQDTSSDSPAVQGSSEPQPEQEHNSGYESPSAPYHSITTANQPRSTNHYEPTNSSNYEPPSYHAEIAAVEESSPEEKPKKKSYVEDDGDDDFEARAAVIRREEKARKDREADETFRRAAEADSKKDTASRLNTKKSGWFGGWLGSKKAEGEDARGTPNAPIKAKLGEQSSFYYDSEQKRWVNKKDPDATPAAKAAPPPPKGPPSRAVSASGVPPMTDTATPPVPPLPIPTATPPINVTNPSISNLPVSSVLSQHQSRSPSPAANEGATEVGASVLTSGMPSAPLSAPPSRPATGMSGASSIDDLLGAPQVRKGGTVRKGKKGRGYVDVMAK